MTNKLTLRVSLLIILILALFASSAFATDCNEKAKQYQEQKGQQGYPCAYFCKPVKSVEGEDICFCYCCAGCDVDGVYRGDRHFKSLDKDEHGE